MTRYGRAGSGREDYCLRERVRGTFKRFVGRAGCTYEGDIILKVEMNKARSEAYASIPPLYISAKSVIHDTNKLPT